jgi:hypothetical protein
MAPFPLTANWITMEPDAHRRGWNIQRRQGLNGRLRELLAGAVAWARAAHAVLKVRLADLRRGLARLAAWLAVPRRRRALRTGGLAALGLLLLAGLAFFALRNAVLRTVLDGRVRGYLKRHPQAVLRVESAHFRGLSAIELTGVRLRSDDGSLTVAMGRGSVRLSFWGMLAGKVRPRRLEMTDLQLDLGPAGPAAVPPASGAAGMSRPPAGRAADYSARADELLDLYFNRLPDGLVVERLTVHTVVQDVRQAFYLPRLAIEGPAFATTFEVFDQGRKWACDIAGEVERGKKRLALRLAPRGGGAAALPFFTRQWGLRVGFDALSVRLASRGRRAGVLGLEGSLAIAGLALNQPRIAADDVCVRNAALDFNLHIGPDYIELAAPTRVSLNRLAFAPYMRFTARPGPQVSVQVPETRFDADDLFASLPAGLFARLAGIRTRGELAFHLDFAIDLARPEGVALDVGLEKRGFRIESFGATDFRAANGPFLYTAYEKERAQRTFLVGPENPDFRSLEQIPAFLKSAVMISEDGAFFTHRGFLLAPFKDSIVANLRAGRFVRGASTISMQLVKNLYLSRQKTIARKLEEMLITWLIEENRLMSKERMLEVYLNIIEWGPLVYGAEEAARYYFAKEVEDLTLAEAIFLACIIPRPKRFMYCFDEERRLRPWVQAYYADVSHKMLARGWIGQEDCDALLPEVTLRGPALLLLRTSEPPSLEPLDGLSRERP